MTTAASTTYSTERSTTSRASAPSSCKVRELLRRLAEEPVTELILCTNPNLEGEATAMYLGRLLADVDLIVTRSRIGSARWAATWSMPTN